MATIKRAEHLIIPVIVGIVLGVFLGSVSFLATAGGHGTYVPAALFFPAPLLLAIALNVISKPALFLAAAQWPFYGAAVGLVSGRGHRTVAIICLAALHALLTVACFVWDRGQFL
jgi:hypothetical protein